MKNFKLIIALAASVSFCSCNMASHYANKRIGHSNEGVLLQDPGQEILPVTESEIENPVEDSLIIDVTIPDKSIALAQPEMTKKEAVPTFTDPLKKHSALKQIRKEKLSSYKKTTQKIHSDSASVNFDALDWNWGIIALVIVFLSIVIAIIMTASSFTILAFLTALAMIFLYLFITIGCVFVLFAFLYIISFAWLFT